MILKELKEELRQVLIQSIENRFSIQYSEFQVTLNKKEGYGDFTSTVAFSISKLLKKPPMEIAKILEAEIKDITPKKLHIEAMEPGFLNIYLPPQWTINVMEEIQQTEFNYGENTIKLLTNIKLANGLLHQEMAYISHRSQWVLEVFQQEDIKPSIDTVKIDHIKFPQEEALLFQMVEWLELMEEGQREISKMISLLQEIVENFWKYYHLLSLRNLEPVHRNLVLNIFLGLKNIMGKA